MKLLKLREHVFYIRSFVNIGVITNDQNEALIIDVGLDERVAWKIKNVLDANNLVLKGIIITHAHADHFGGARYLSEHSGARIYCGTLEKATIENPILESLCLFGGSYPPWQLRRKYFCAPGAAVQGCVSPGDTTIEGFSLEIVDLSGHTLGQIGVAVERALFCADSMATPDQIQKQGILKHVSIEQSLETCDRLNSRKELVFVPAHSKVSTDIRPLIDGTRELLNGLLHLVLKLAADPIGFGELLARICTIKEISIENVAQYHVLQLSIRACLGCLMDRTQISVVFKENRQLFQRCKDLHSL